MTQFKTFEQWEKDGFVVCSGEKSYVKDKDTGESLFSENQVVEQEDCDVRNYWSILNGY